MRSLATVCLVLAALLGAACAAAPPADPPVDPEAVSELHRRMDAVARAQVEADRRLATAVDAVQQLDEAVAGLRDPERVDAAKEAWPRAHAAWQAATTDGLREGLIDLALAVDRAREALEQVLVAADDDWAQRYLDAEDGVLEATRDYAETADELAQQFLRHWPTYAELHARTARFVEQRWFYRTAQEAADAYELAVQPLLGELAAAQHDIADARRVRDAAAEDVNAAVETAAETWEQRPVTTTPRGGS